MPLEIYDIQGGPAGINRSVGSHIIEDFQFENATDVLFDRVGFIRQRGPLNRAQNTDPTNTASITDLSPYYMVHTVDPGGTTKVLIIVLNGTTPTAYGLSSDFESATALTGTIAPASATKFVSAPNLAGSGGVWIGGSNAYSTNSYTMLWRGCTLADPTTTSETISVTRGATAVTGSGTSFLTEAEPGSFLFAKTDTYTTATVYIGVVKSVASDTSLTLEEGALDTCTTKDYALKAFRYLQDRYSEGRITCTTASTALTGGGTKWRSAGISGNHYIYRRRDFAYIGKVSSVVDEDNITLAANAAQACTNEEYVSVAVGETNALNTSYEATGWIPANYANRMWFINIGDASAVGGSIIARFSDLYDADSIYIARNDGNFVEVPNFYGQATTPILHAIGTFAGLVFFKENEVSILVGNSPDNFNIRPMYNDGLLDGRTVVAYENGVVWTGRKGIHYFDGASVTNLTQPTLGDWWTRNLLTHDVTTQNAWGWVHRDHYMVYIESLDETIVVNLKNGSVSEFTNVQLRGSTQLPDSTTLAPGAHWGVIADDNATADTYIVDIDDLFDLTGTDALTCDNETAGPQMELRSKKFSIDDGLVKKWWKAFGIYYRADGDNVDVEIATGLDGAFADATVVPTQFNDTNGAWTRGRVKFHKFDTHLQIKLVPEAGTLSDFQLTDMSLFFKFQRKDRW